MNGEALILEGVHIAEQPFTQVPFWPFVQDITNITPPTTAQSGVHESMVQRSSYWGILEIKEERRNLMWMVSNMHQGKTRHALPQTDLLNWGN